MTVLRILGNVFWCLFGGLVLCVLWGAAGILCCITIVGIPFGIQCFKIAGFVIFPFGRHVEGGGGFASCLMNVLWILFCGWELAVTSVGVGIVYCVTIVGIPLGIQSFKFARLAFWPFGAQIVS